MFFLAFYLFSCTAKNSVNDVASEKKVSKNSSEINIEDTLSTEESNVVNDLLENALQSDRYKYKKNLEILLI